MEESVKKRVKTKEYSQEFRYSMVKKYLRSGESYRSLSRKYGLDLSGNTIRSWVLRYSPSESIDGVLNIEKGVLPGTMSKETNKEKDTEKKPDTEKLLTSRIHLLEKELRTAKKDLEHEKLKSEALDFMIDVAESQLKIEIRKKPGAKQ